jgi:hypothetical protein
LPLERFDFYKRAKQAYCIVATSEQAPYGNLIIKKGCIRPEGEEIKMSGDDLPSKKSLVIINK